MTTVSAGATGTFTFTSSANAASITLDQGERAIFRVVSSAGVQLASDNIQASRVLGPYPAGAVMSLTAINGDVDYTTIDADNYFSSRAGINADSQVVDATGSPVSGAPISSITRNGLGQVTAWVSPPSGAGAATYNADGTVATVTENGLTRTVTYNPDGTVASYL